MAAQPEPGRSAVVTALRGSGEQRETKDAARDAAEDASSSPLRKRIAELMRMLAMRDATIDLLIRRLNEAASAEDESEPAEAGAADAAQNGARAEAEQRRLQDALDKLRVAQSRLLQSQKMVSIGQLAAGIAHELNTPIQYVADNVLFLGRAFESLQRALGDAMAVVAAAKAGAVAPELIAAAERSYADGDLDFVCQDLPDAVEQSRDGLRRIATIVGAMKKFSHPSSEVMAPADLAEIVETTIVVARNEWKYVAEIETHFAPDLPPVPCVRDEIGNVVLNLIVNAAHAISEVIGADRASKGRIAISTRRVGPWAEIVVSDTGCGIAPTVQSRVFDPFFTTKPVGVGTGQGLSIAYATVVEQHHGEIFFDTECAMGTTFHVRLPLAAREEAD